MKNNKFVFSLLLTAVFLLSGCAAAQTVVPTRTAAPEDISRSEKIIVKITVGETELLAEMEDNETVRTLVEQMPFTLEMQDLYGREMCYRYGRGTLPTNEAEDKGYKVGDISVWPPMGSLVILYRQNGEIFEQQYLGHIEEGVEIFETTGDAEVTFSLYEEPEEVSPKE